MIAKGVKAKFFSKPINAVAAQLTIAIINNGNYHQLWAISLQIIGKSYLRDFFQLQLAYKNLYRSGVKNLTDFRNFNLKQFDTLLINYLSKISLPVLRVSLGIIFIWFGALKPFGDSPANDVITKTIYWFDPDIFIPILGYWEMLIGLCLLYTP